MEWLGGIAIVALIFAVPFVLDALKKKGGKTGAVAGAVDTVGTGIGAVFRFIFVKGLGLLCVIGGIVLISMSMNRGAEFWPIVGVCVIIAYGIYLLFPGDKWVIFFTV